MPGLPPMVAPPAEQVDDPVTATDAANAVDAVLRGYWTNGCATAVPSTPSSPGNWPTVSRR